ncbi:hypothetical protein TD95_001085 [Thielaviopsis punctulata]|uniref:SWI5-dependent HO expression protein 3 n=1 Tax=Thielaviopsis punctulata TaxID=72032 RepID=A0A0F4ZIV8_9PEZI|nr:hypothetical protein TD95_001085 [Thielaviopsis punctulata]
MEVLLTLILLTFAVWFSVSKPRPNLLRSASSVEKSKSQLDDQDQDQDQSQSPSKSKNSSKSPDHSLNDNDRALLSPVSLVAKTSHKELRIVTSTSNNSDPKKKNRASASLNPLASPSSPFKFSSMRQSLNVLSRKRSPESHSPSPSSQPPLSLSPSPLAESFTPVSAASGSIMQTSISTAATTIRTVPSFEGVASDSSSDTPSVTTRNSAFSSSVHSTAASMASSHGNSTEDKLAAVTFPASSSPSLSSPSTTAATPLLDPSQQQQQQKQSSSSSLSSQLPSGVIEANSNGNGHHDTRSNPDSTTSISTSTTIPTPLSISAVANQPANSLEAQSVAHDTTSNTHTRILSTDSLDLQYPPIAPPLPSPEHPSEMGHAANAAHDPSWDSTIGKAGLGKTGRVINKLVSDNEALKRDIQIERLRAEESKQAAKMIEEKLDRIVSDYESRLLEANVTKTLLARKERQVEALSATVDLERARAKEATDREKVWQEETDKLRQSSQTQVDEANNLAQLMEGRYNAIASHWKDQGEETMRVVTKMRSEIVEIVEERRKDDDKINTLRELCDQQHLNISTLQRQKEEILAQFEKYKREQEEQLRDIKELSAQREEHMTKLLAESKEALDKLRWALNVKNNVKGAQ